MKFIPEQVEDQSRNMYIFLFLMMLAVYFGFQTWQMIITNFATEEAGFDGIEMGIVQSVRELPGLLSFMAIYFLFYMREHRLANLFALMLGVGVFLTGLFPTFGGILLTTFIMSTGYHFYDTLSQSLILQYFSVKSAPIVLGKLRGLAAMASISVAVVVLILSNLFTYKVEFMIIGGVVILITLSCFRMNPVRADLPVQTRKLKFKKNYWLYYVLTFLSGGRRQIYIVFALFLLVKKFNFSVTQVTILFLVNNLINFFMNPLIGKAVSRFGERKVATFEYTSVIVIFSVYAFTENAILAAFMYICDQFVMNMMIAERTFFQKISEPEDIAPGTAMGFALNHVVAVIIPLICGILWMINYRIVFFAGVLIAVTNLFFIQKIDIELEKARIRKGLS